MASRRDLPKDIYSDNGTNFVGGANELQELQALDKKKLQGKQPVMEWSGISTHQKPHKKAINAILGQADVTDEELLSAVVGAKGLLNSRPLTYQSASHSDFVPLTPNHFIHSQLGGSFAPEAESVVNFSLKRRWRRVQEIVRHFWNRWLNELIPTLNNRKKWFCDEKDFKPGDG